MIEKQRLSWLDVAKAIAIILMVMGHTSIPQMMNNYIFAFHMPLFFIASGWTTNWSKYSYRNFVWRRVKTLLLPFVIYSIIVLLIQMHFEWMSMQDWLNKGWGDGYALWFIPVLFLASVISRGIYSFREVEGGRLFWLIVILLLSAGIDLFHNHIRLPWNLSTVPYAVFMIIIGSEWSKVGLKNKSKRKGSLQFFAAALMVGIISHFWRLDLCFNRILPAFPLTIGALVGTFMIFVFSQLLCQSRTGLARMLILILQKIGTETYIIVAFSPIIIMVINHCLSLNVLLKYFLLIVLLIMMSVIKNGIAKLWN